MADYSKQETAAMAMIELLEDPQKLRNLIQNAKRKGSEPVRLAAFKKLCEILPSAALGTVEHDFWQTIHAFEEMLTDEKGKTTRLTRTRQKIARVGERQVLADFALHPTSTTGFDKLIEMGMPELTGEAIVLRHATEFDEEHVRAARARLQKVGVDTDAIIKLGAPHHG